MVAVLLQMNQARLRVACHLPPLETEEKTMKKRRRTRKRRRVPRDRPFPALPSGQLGKLGRETLLCQQLNTIIM